MKQEDKLEKAIEYALATLRIDGMHLRPEFVEEYRKKHNLPKKKVKY